MPLQSQGMPKNVAKWGHGPFAIITAHCNLHVQISHPSRLNTYLPSTMEGQQGWQEEATAVEGPWQSFDFQTLLHY